MGFNIKFSRGNWFIYNAIKSLCQLYTIVDIIYGNKKKIDGYSTTIDGGLFLDDEFAFVPE